MDDKAYKIVEAEAERLRQLLDKRVADAARECSKIRMNTGALKSSSRRQALLFVRSMEDLDNAIIKAKRLVHSLQKEIDLDQRRVGVMRKEEHDRKEKIRQERVERLRAEVEARRERRNKLQSNRGGGTGN